MEHIRVITGEDQEEVLESIDSFVGEIINAKVVFRDGEIRVPRLMEIYKDDFGGTDETLLEFIYKYHDNPEIEMNQAFHQIKEKSLWIAPLV